MNQTPSTECEFDPDHLYHDHYQTADQQLAARELSFDELIDKLIRAYDALGAANERLRNGDGLEYSLSLTNADLRAEIERQAEHIKGLEDAYAIMTNVADNRQHVIERLRAALKRHHDAGPNHRDAHCGVCHELLSG